MASVILSDTVSTQLDSSGNGTVSLGPLSAREIWYPQSVYVSVNTQGAEAVCKIYVGDGTEQRNYRDATFTGSTGDSSARVSNDTVRCGHRIYAVWSKGDPGATASLSVNGMKTV